MRICQGQACTYYKIQYTQEPHDYKYNINQTQTVTNKTLCSTGLSYTTSSNVSPLLPELLQPKQIQSCENRSVT